MPRLKSLFPRGTSWWVMVIGLGLVAVFGVFAYWQQFQNGLIVTDLRSIGAGGPAWGLYVMFDVYFVGISLSGIVIAALIRLFHIEDLKPLARLAELITVLALCMSGCAIIADLGRPLLGLINIPAYGRPASPFFGTFSSVTGGYLFASVVFFYLASRPDAALCAEQRPRWAWAYRLVAMGFKGTKSEFRRHHRVSFWLALIILFLLVVEQSTLAFVFGIQSGRPGWFSALRAPGFLVLAGASGIGMLILIAAFLRRYLNLYHVISDRAFSKLGNFMGIMVLVYMYFIGIEELTTNYVGPTAATTLSHAIGTGMFGVVFWITIGCFAIPLTLMFVQFLKRKVWMPGLVAACLLVNIAAILERYLLVVPSQTSGMLLPYAGGTYSPTWQEYAIIAALFAAGMCGILIYSRLFPIVPVRHEEETLPVGTTAEKCNDHSVLRMISFILTLIVGLTLVVVGLAATFRIGTTPGSDPVIPFAPAIFIAGMGITLFSAIVYEIFPSGRPVPASRPTAVEQPATPAGTAQPAEPPAPEAGQP